MVRRLSRPDEGLTLVEMLVAMSLMLVALTMFGSVLFAVQRAGSRADQLGRSADAAYQALAEMDRQLRSGYIASAYPLPGTVASVRIYTEAYAPKSGGTVARCVAWAIVDMPDGNQALFTGWWTPPAGSLPSYIGGVFKVPSSPYSGSRLVTDEITGAGDKAFERKAADPDLRLGERLIVTLTLREATDPSLTPWINVISTSITPRNNPRSGIGADSDVALSVTREHLCD